MQNIKQWSYEYQFYSLWLGRLEIIPESTVSVADVLSYWPLIELNLFYSYFTHELLFAEVLFLKGTYEL